jgi:flagellar motor switch protein FliM
MTPQSHDFTRPLRLSPDLNVRLAPWLNRATSIFSESMAALGCKVQAQALDRTTAWPLETLNQWNGRPLGFRLLVAGVPTLLAMPNSLAQCLVAGLLGDSIPAETTDRELSAVELDLCELVIQTVVSSLAEAWLEETPVQFDLRDREPNLRRSKLFRPNETLVVCRSSVAVQSQEHLWSWLVRLETLLALFGTEHPAAVAKPDAPQRLQMESMVREMKLPLTVKLGRVQITAPQLSELQVGDVVVLHQRTSEPLKAFVSGRPAFLGWPGQIAGKQAFQIETELAK